MRTYAQNGEIVVNALPEEDRLLQLAEEASELSQAATKLVRIMRGHNPSPVTRVTAWQNLREELADVENCKSVLGLMADHDVMLQKMARWAERLQE